jgi:hypothetical protein
MIDNSKGMRELKIEFTDLQTGIRNQVAVFIKIRGSCFWKRVDFARGKEVEGTRIKIKRIRFISSSF